MDDFGAPGLDRLPSKAKGAYILVILMKDDRQIRVGRLGSRKFPAGSYAYVGSAMNGLRARISRHTQPAVKLHWHIDYMLQTAIVTAVYCYPSAERLECDLARYLALRTESVPGFGCSDCHCRSHLFILPDQAFLEATLKDAGYPKPLRIPLWLA